MKKTMSCLILMFLFSGFANAQTAKTMTGTVVRVIHGGRWSGLIIKVGKKDYGIQTSYEPSAGDESRGGKGWEIEAVGNVWQAGRKVQVFYTEVTSNDYDGVKSWLKATKIVEVKNPQQVQTQKAAQTISVPHMNSLHREVLQNWLASKPSWRPAIENDAYIGSTKEWREYLKNEIRTWGNHPFYVADDFNSDGNQDFAVILIKKAGRSYKYAVAIFNGSFSGNKKVAPTFYSERVVGGGDLLLWVKGDEFGNRFIVGPPASDSGTSITPRGRKYFLN